MDKKLSKGFENLPLPIQMCSAGFAASCADFLTYPLDTLKVRAQIQGEGQNKVQHGLFKMITTLTKEEGFLALYNGLSAGLQRQFCFASVRIGIYDEIKKFYHTLFGVPLNSINIPLRTLSGVTSACIAVIIAQPTDVVKIRFQAAAKTPGKRRYANTRAAYREILNTAGAKGLWQGVYANMTRNAIVNVTEVVVYDTIKDALLHHGFFNDGIHLHCVTAGIAGIITTVVVSPVDVTKTRYMNAPAGKYKSAIDCSIRTYTQEGFKAFYKGFTPNAARMVTWNLGLWIIYEQVKIYAVNRYGKEQD